MTTREVPIDCEGLDGPPDYEPDQWNDCPDTDGCPDADDPDHKDHHQGKNNCYNYACNIKNDKFAQPGAGGNPPYVPKGLTCNEYEKAAIADGLQLISGGKKGCDEDCPEGDCHKVALAISPHDFHWLRLDKGGRWSHKPGGTQATDRDSSGDPINNIRQADLKPYKLCSCFCVCKCQVNITNWSEALKKLEEEFKKLKEKLQKLKGEDKRTLNLFQKVMQEGQVLVTLDVFSGRPNPRWLIPQSKIATFIDKLSDLPHAKPVALPLLGYRGFVLTFTRENNDFPENIRVFNETILIYSGSKKIIYKKDSQGLELWLRNQAKRKGYGKVILYLLKSLREVPS